LNTQAQWEAAYHGTRLEGLFATIHDGQLVKGPSRKLGKSRVFCFSKDKEYKAQNYAIWVPLFLDGYFWRVMWELRVDRSDSNFTCRDNTDQWCIQERSVRLAALYMECWHVIEFAFGSYFHRAWDSRLEVNPLMRTKRNKEAEDQKIRRQDFQKNPPRNWKSAEGFLPEKHGIREQQKKRRSIEHLLQLRARHYSSAHVTKNCELSCSPETIKSDGWQCSRKSIRQRIGERPTSPRDRIRTRNWPFS
jgi:hypothetical protein